MRFKLMLPKNKVYYADIYEAVDVPRGSFPDEIDVGEENRFYKTISAKAYQEAMVLELKNNKYIDLAEVNGAVDYLFLSTCAKFKIPNKKLISYGYGEAYKPGRKYVRHLESAYKTKGAKNKTAFEKSKTVSLEKAVEAAQNKRAKDENCNESCY